MYDYVIATHIPAFYKVNLYNELAKKLNILVIFIASNTVEKRADDFVTLENAHFDYRLLHEGDFQHRDIKKNIIELRNLTSNIEFKKLLVGGWDLMEFWYLIFTNNKTKNCLALESTINESAVGGAKGFIKRLFLNRISTVFASGKLHTELLDALKFMGEVRITQGVGIINKPEFEVIGRQYQKRFLYIGRLSQEKNIALLVHIFNKLPTEYRLNIVGTGPLEDELRAIANPNIRFIGQVENKNLKEYFLSNDIFILPSQSEPWGLVVEEAMYFGMPVMVSRSCGSSELVIDGVNGFIFDANCDKDISGCILNLDCDKYLEMCKEVRLLSIVEKDHMQVDAY